MISITMISFILVSLLLIGSTAYRHFPSPSRTARVSTSLSQQSTTVIVDSEKRVTTLKLDILQLGAALDRGQAYNPTSGEYYKEKIEYAKTKVQELIACKDLSATPVTMEQLDGEWELVFCSVPHGIFRSSPFFLAIQEAYTRAGQTDKALLFFKLHELQTLSWGISKVGRVAQVVDSERKVFISEFDTSLFSLTVVPLLGWGKLLPTFGGTVVTVSNITSLIDNQLAVTVDYTTSRPVRGLSGLPGLGQMLWGSDKGPVKVPVSAIWKRLPWNKGELPMATLTVRYIDKSFRIMEDAQGELFVYTRPVFREDLPLSRA